MAFSLSSIPQKALRWGFGLEFLLRNAAETGSRVGSTLSKGEGMAFPPNKIPPHRPTSRGFSKMLGSTRPGNQGHKAMARVRREERRPEVTGEEPDESRTCPRSCCAWSGITLGSGTILSCCKLTPVQEKMNYCRAPGIELSLQRLLNKSKFWLPTFSRGGKRETFSALYVSVR